MISVFYSVGNAIFQIRFGLGNISFEFIYIWTEINKKMEVNSFTNAQFTPLIIGSLLLLLTVLLFTRKRDISLFLLFSGAFFFGFFIANLNPFLEIWDEQYHALVAKNLSKNFLNPVLLSNPIFEYNRNNWTENSVWLHKQPLFLWHMALSIKLFGPTVLAVRLPSIIMHAIIPLFIYRIGKVVITERTGFFGAVFFTLAYFPLELIAGRFSTDHNDVAFLFYVTASVWAWFEYQNSKKRHWLVVIGLFAGGAILVKWLVGLLIYGVWGISKLISEYKEKFSFKSYLPILYSSLVCVVIFLPWQLYIFNVYPDEALYELQLNSAHFSEAIEGHGGPWYFHFTEAFTIMYGSGDALPFIFLFAFVLFIKRIERVIFRVFLIVIVVVIYSFYSMAATKMLAFTVVLTPYIYLSLGSLIDSGLIYLESKKANRIATLGITTIVLVGITFMLPNFSKITQYHGANNEKINEHVVLKNFEKKIILSLEEELNEEHILFNCQLTVNGHIPFMFFTNHRAFSFVPSHEQLVIAKKTNTNIAILDLGNLPDYINSDKSIKKIDVTQFQDLTNKLKDAE